MNPFKRKLVTDHFTNLIAEGTEINGSLRFSGVIQIGGNVKGDIISSEAESDKGKDCIHVLREGNVSSELLKASNIVIDGKVTSKNINAENTLRIGKGARITGAQLRYRRLEIEEGAFMHRCELINLDSGQETDQIPEVEV